MKPTNEDIVEISRALALWAHIMDDHELDRLGECLTEDAVWDGSVFGGDPVVGLDAIADFMNAPGHAKAHHTTNLVVSEGPGDEVRARSKGLSLLPDHGALTQGADKPGRGAQGIPGCPCPAPPAPSPARSPVRDVRG